jgi:hypothetical protein
MLGLVCVSVGCSGLGSEFKGPKYEGEYFVYRTQESDPVACEAGSEGVDRFVEVVSDFLGQPVEGGSRYYKFESAEALQASGECRSTAAACSDSDEIMTIKPVDGHELTHWVMSQGVGAHLPLLFAEGTATAISCEPHFEPETDDWDFRDFGLEPPISDAFNHAQAGRLMLGVLAQTGDPASWMLLARLSPHRDPDQLAAMALNLGVDLDAAWQMAVEGRFPSCIPLFACTGPELEWGHNTLGAGCRGYDPFTLPTNEGKGIRLRSSELKVRVMPCSVDGPPRVLHQVIAYRPGGDYEFWFRAPDVASSLVLNGAEAAGSERTTEVQLGQLSSAFVPVCVLPQSTIPARDNVALVIEGGRSEYISFVREGDEPWELRWDEEIPDGISVSTCEGCEGALGEDCVELSALAVGGRHEFTERREVILRVDATEVLEEATLLRVVSLE